MKLPAFLTETREPWVSTAARKTSKKDVPEGMLLIELDGARMTKLAELYDEFASAFQFPGFFGRNFNALDECLTDLDWLPARGYLVEIVNSERLLEKEDEEVRAGLLQIFERAGKDWATPVIDGEDWDRSAVPFHTVLVRDKNGDDRGFGKDFEPQSDREVR